MVVSSTNGTPAKALDVKFSNVWTVRIVGGLEIMLMIKIPRVAVAG